ncbi:MAG: hypothetical protein HC816_11625 [Leptolyngbyaceae cyanobacterium RM1_1_2]|nr:hypothetical protein [Leptolyngbyaceae cyanobacterium RM1_1_2]
MFPQHYRQPARSQPLEVAECECDSAPADIIPALLELHVATEAPLASRSVTDTETSLDWTSLPTFTLLTDQFQHLGIVFENAVVVEPSNPAYPTYSAIA